MAPSFPQKCLAFHGPMLYEAKTIKIWDPEAKTVRTKASENSGDQFASQGVVPPDLPAELENKIAYYIHYKGWKSTWDEWVSDDRVLAWNEENLRTQKELKQMALAAASKKRHGGSSASSVAISVVPGGHYSMGANGYSEGAGPSSYKEESDFDGEDDSSKGDRSSPLEASGSKRRESYKDDSSHTSRGTKRGRTVDMDLERVSFFFLFFILPSFMFLSNTMVSTTLVCFCLI